MPIAMADTPNDSKAYLGIAENKVAPGKREERKSVGCERYASPFEASSST